MRHHIVLLQRQFGQKGAVLPGHTRDERNFRRNDLAMNGVGGCRGSTPIISRQAAIA